MCCCSGWAIDPRSNFDTRALRSLLWTAEKPHFVTLRSKLTSLRANLQFQQYLTWKMIPPSNQRHVMSHKRSGRRKREKVEPTERRTRATLCWQNTKKCNEKGIFWSNFRKIFARIQHKLETRKFDFSGFRNKFGHFNLKKNKLNNQRNKLSWSAPDKYSKKASRAQTKNGPQLSTKA